MGAARSQAAPSELVPGGAEARGGVGTLPLTTVARVTSTRSGPWRVLLPRSLCPHLAGMPPVEGGGESYTGVFQVETRLIDKLDSLMSEGKGDETYRELFNSM